MHQHGVQIYFQIVKSVQHDEAHPDCVERSEIITTCAGHCDEAELAQGFEEQAVRDPYASVCD